MLARSGLTVRRLQAHAAHDLQPVLEGEDDPLLRRAEQVGPAVEIEVQAVEGRSRVAVVQGSLGAVAVGQDDQAGCSDRRLGGQGVHLLVCQLRGTCS